MQRLVQWHTPDERGLAYALWTRQAAAELVQACCDIALTVHTIGLYLSRWGFTPQRPLRKAYEHSPAAVKSWHERKYPLIAARARAEGAEIHWGDETGLRSDDVRSRSYAPRGKTPAVQVNHRRQGLSVISTVTNRGHMRWKTFYGALNATILIDFLRRLVRDAQRKVFLIPDNLRVHHSRPVEVGLDSHRAQIEVFYLPSYSPELNPGELANADLKQAVTKLAPTRTKLAVVKATTHHLHSVQRQPKRIRSYFEHEPVRYAA